MTVSVLHTSQTLPDFLERVFLDGVTFQLRFRWNSRLEDWFLDILTEAGSPIVYGRRCVIGWILLRQSRHLDAIPAGEILAFDTTLRDVAPGLTDFGTRVLALYLDASELEAAGLA